LRIAVDEKKRWYHSSNRVFDILREGSTITQWEELAAAFSHKPSMLCVDDDMVISHNGREKGYLYMIDEPIKIGADAYQHPRTTIGENTEFITSRPLRVVLVCELDAPMNTQVCVAPKQ